MADFITYFTGSDGLVDGRVYVITSSIARTISIGSNWNVLRIGIRFVFEDSGADIVNYPRVAFGLCSGTSSLFNLSGSNAQHFLGVYSANSAASNADPQYFGYMEPLITCVPNYLNVFGFNTNNSLYYGSIDTRVCLVQTGSFAGFYTVNYHTGNISATSSIRTGVILQYSKSAQGITVSVGGMGNTCNGTRDLTIPQLEEWCTQVAPVYTPPNYNALTVIATNVPVTESVYGYLDTINFYWNKPYPGIYISDVMAAKIA